MTTQPVSDPTRNDTWEMLVDLERHVRYYLKLADRYMLWYRAIRYFMLFGILAEGALIYFLSGTPESILWLLAGIGGFLLGFITVFDAVTNYAQKAANCQATHLLCDGIKMEAERLWRDIESYRIGDGDAEMRYSELVNRWSQATLMTTLLEAHDHDNIQSAKEASQMVENRYAR